MERLAQEPQNMSSGRVRGYGQPSQTSPLQSSTKSGVGLQVPRYVLCLGHSAQGSDCILAGGSGSEARTLCDWLLSLVWPSTFWTLCEA